MMGIAENNFGAPAADDPVSWFPGNRSLGLAELAG